MNRIKELRIEKGFTQAELAKLLEINQTAVGKYERGELEPNIQTLKKLSAIFEVTVDFIIANSDDFGVIALKTENEPSASPKEKELLSIFNSLGEEYQAQILEYARYFGARLDTKRKN